MRPAISINSSLGVKSTSRLTKLKRTPRTPAACMSCSSRSLTLRRTVATPRALPFERGRRRPSRGCRRRGRWPARSRCARSRGGRAARTAAPCWHRRACTCARARTGNSLARAEHVAMGVHAARRQLEARLARVGVPVEPAGSLFEGQLRLPSSVAPGCGRPRCASRRCARNPAAPLAPNTPASARSATHAWRSAVPLALHGSRPASRTVTATSRTSSLRRRPCSITRWNKYAPCLLPVDAGKGFLQRRDAPRLRRRSGARW